MSGYVFACLVYLNQSICLSENREKILFTWLKVYFDVSLSVENRRFFFILRQVRSKQKWIIHTQTIHSLLVFLYRGFYEKLYFWRVLDNGSKKCCLYNESKDDCNVFIKVINKVYSDNFHDKDLQIHYNDLLLNKSINLHLMYILLPISKSFNFYQKIWWVIYDLRVIFAKSFIIIRERCGSYVLYTSKIS